MLNVPSSFSSSISISETNNDDKSLELSGAIAELELLKYFLIEKDNDEETFKKLLKLDVDFFINPIFQTVFYIVKYFYQKNKKFPNSKDIEIIVEETNFLDEITYLPVRQLDKKLLIEKIKKIAKYLDYKNKDDYEEKTGEKLISAKTVCLLIIKQLVKKNSYHIVKNIGETKGEKLETLITIREKIDKTIKDIQRFENTLEDETLDNFFNLNEEVRRNIRATGIFELDEIINEGTASKEVILLAGSPGTGKTTFALYIMLNYIRQYAPAGYNDIYVYITLEQPPKILWAKILAMILKMNDKDILHCKPSELNIDKRIMEEINEIYKPRMRIKEFLALTPFKDIEAYIRNLRETFPNNHIIIFIDYVNDIVYGNKGRIEKWQELDAILTNFEGLAHELDLTIWTLCQAHPKLKKPNKKDILNYYDRLFNAKDLYGAKVGLLRKVAVALGLKKDINNKVYLSIFKNRLTGILHELFEVNYDRNTSQFKIHKVDVNISVPNNENVNNINKNGNENFIINANPINLGEDLDI